MKLNEILKVQLEMAYTDIAYNYIVCEDGNVYEGRGLKTGAHTAKGNLSISPNLSSVGIAFLGHFDREFHCSFRCKCFK